MNILLKDKDNIIKYKNNLLSEIEKNKKLNEEQTSNIKNWIKK